MNDYTKLYETITDQIIKEMESGVIPWRKPWVALSGAYNAKSKRRYGFLNQMILYMPGAYASFKQWCELGCKVKKGAKASWIMEWFSKKIEFETENENGEAEKHSYLKWYPRTYPVFHESMVEGYIHTEPEVVSLNPIEEAENVVSAYEDFSGITAIKRTSESDRAFYSPVRDYIQVPKLEQYKSPNEYYSTLFHEMVHSTGHSSRLGRGLDEKLASFGSDDYSREELVAELGSSMIMARLHIDTPQTFKNSTAYLQNWLSALKNDKSLLISASSYAESATRYIFHEA